MVCTCHALTLLEEMKSINEEDIGTVLEEARLNLDQVREELSNLRAGYPMLMKEVDTQHCEYYVLKQFAAEYERLGHKGQLDEKHVEMIQHELADKIHKLKLKNKVSIPDVNDIFHSSQLGHIFEENKDAIMSVDKNETLFVKPAQILLPDPDDNISVANVLLKSTKSKAEIAETIVNSKVYLLARGSVYEHLKSEFAPQDLCRTFTTRNKDL